MSADYFAPFDTVRYEGPETTSDLAYRWYDKDGGAQRHDGCMPCGLIFARHFGWIVRLRRSHAVQPRST